jgi:uncharacterized protein (TIGR03437 family)
MDAIRTPLNRKALIILTAALLAAVPAFAAGSLNVNGGASAAVPLNGANTTATVSATSTGSAISYTASIAWDATGAKNWLSPISAGTTPATVYVTMTSIPSPSYGPGPFTATITLTDTANSADTAKIVVTFTPGSGIGPTGPVSVTPGSLSLQLSTAGSAQGALTVQSTSASSTSFTAYATSQTSGWSLNVSQTAGSVSSSSPFIITVTASTSLTTGTTYTGTVTVTPSGYSPIPVNVTLTVTGSGGGGGNGNTDLTLTNGSVTASNLSLAAAYNTGGSVPATIATLPVSSASGQTNYRILSIVYASGANWLAIPNFDGSTPVTVPIGTALVLTTASGVTSLATGSYQATVSLGETSVAGPFATVLVTLYVNSPIPAVSASPANWTLTAALNGSPQTQTFIITPGPGTTLGTVSSDSVWIIAGALAANGSLLVTADPTGLTVGTYSGNVLVNSNAAGSPLQIPITMVVSSSGGAGGAQVVAPGSLTFAYQINGPALLPPTVTIPGTAGQSFTATADQSWVDLDPPGAPLPGSMLVRINTAGLAAQTTPYTSNITVTTPNGAAIIPVKLLVTASPVIFPNPGSLTFTSTGSGYASQKVDFVATDNSTLTLTASALNTPWVQFTMAPNAATHGQTLTVSVNATGMATGTYSGVIQVASSGFVNSPVNYPVVLVVNGGGNGQGGALTLSYNTLTFNAVVNGLPSTQTLTVGSNSGATPFTALSQTLTGSGWLTISPSGDLTTSQDITVTANPAGLAVGTYNGTILLTANSVTQQVPVALVVSATVTGGNVQVAPTSLNLSYQIGGTAPTAQLQVSNAVSGSAQIGFTVAALNASWLTVTPASANTPATLAVGVNTAGLTAGPYNGTIQISPTGGQAVNVPVALTVTAPSISVAATTLTFNYQAGGSQPAPQTVQVTGGANANFTARASSTGGWLSVTPASGTANPATLTVSVNTAGLTAGTSYPGTITVTGVSPTTGSATINVTLNVTSPSPAISGLGNAASGYSLSISPGELISIYGTQLGPATPVLTQLDSTGKYVATTLGGVQVFVSGYAAPVMYASAGQVNAVVPYEVASLKSVSVWVKYMNQTSNTVTVALSATAPGVFTLNASGSGQGLILNAADYGVNGPAKPAAKGSYVLVYVTGEGQTMPSGTTGLVTVAQAVVPYTPGPLLTVVPWVNGQIAYFNFAGEAPGFVAGVMQLNVQIPANAPSGDLPLVVSVGGNNSQTGVTVRVQ